MFDDEIIETLIGMMQRAKSGSATAHDDFVSLASAQAGMTASALRSRAEELFQLADYFQNVGGCP